MEPLFPPPTHVVESTVWRWVGPEEEVGDEVPKILCWRLVGLDPTLRVSRGRLRPRGSGRGGDHVQMGAQPELRS